VPGPGHGVVAAAEERAVGFGGECCLYFLLGSFQMGPERVGGLLIGIDYRLETREQLIVLRNSLGHRTGGEEEHH